MRHCRNWAILFLQSVLIQYCVSKTKRGELRFTSFICIFYIEIGADSLSVASYSLFVHTSLFITPNINPYKIKNSKTPTILAKAIPFNCTEPILIAAPLAFVTHE